MWNRSAHLGLVSDSSTGFNGVTRSPDVAWKSYDQWNRISTDERKKFPPLCPDFVVKLLNESDTLKGTADKMREYRDNGCRLAWMIDPKTEEVRIYRADESVIVARGFDTKLSGEEVLPGFSFNLQLLR
ncbi:Uma2 family endonuclease [Spirosoma aerolatum]|uniref:Uma2 family endonuclease n=1 Tax=Spirosoma aerolatum TaxID=1211326 RepID=UPI001FE884ED|nr:Uma2 family endonuclease [Spirosoma aerolatum]